MQISFLRRYIVTQLQYKQGQVLDRSEVKTDRFGDRIGDRDRGTGKQTMTHKNGERDRER